MRLIDKRNFRKWLKGKNKADIVGLSKQYDSCPIACYLEETHNAFRGGISANELILKINFHNPLDMNTQSTPKWAKNFIELVDSDFGLGEEVTAAEALTRLEAT